MARTTDTKSTALGPVLPIGGMGDLADAGKLLAQASFLGCRNPGEGFVLMATCQQTGMSLIQFQQKYHFRQGRFSIQAHALLAEFVERGGTYKIIERSPTRAALELTKDGNVYVSEMTWEQAAAEPFVYRGDESDALAELAKPVEKRRLKAKYQTPRSRMQMLWARALSDGVVVVDPGARGGIYTPEETDDFLPALPAHGTTSRLQDPVEITAEVATARVAEASPVAAVVEVTATPAIAEPDPFAKPGQKQDSSTPTNGAQLCPFPGPMSGIPWTKMETEHLELALTLDAPGFTQAHRQAIEAILAERRIMGGK